MFAKYTIPINQVQAQTASTINIPVTLQYQIVDNSELIERLFVNTETQRSVNPILDYDKVRFMPVDNSNIPIANITYSLFFLDSNNNMLQPTYYSNADFDDGDIKFLRNYFTESYLELSFYDSENSMTQNLVSELLIYNRLSSTDYYPTGTINSGIPKPASQIPMSLILSNPIIVPRAFYEGYHIYTYKDDYRVDGPPKYLYMRARYYNAKTGKFINLMTESSPYKIDVLVNKLYTRYELFRTTTGFYYKINNDYSTNVTLNQNISSSNNMDLTVKLYQVQAL